MGHADPGYTVDKHYRAGDAFMPVNDLPTKKNPVPVFLKEGMLQDMTSEWKKDCEINSNLIKKKPKTQRKVRWKKTKRLKNFALKGNQHHHVIYLLILSDVLLTQRAYINRKRSSRADTSNVCFRHQSVLWRKSLELGHSQEPSVGTSRNKKSNKRKQYVGMRRVWGWKNHFPG